MIDCTLCKHATSTQFVHYNIVIHIFCTFSNMNIKVSGHNFSDFTKDITEEITLNSYRAFTAASQIFTCSPISFTTCTVSTFSFFQHFIDSDCCISFYMFYAYTFAFLFIHVSSKCSPSERFSISIFTGEELSPSNLLISFAMDVLYTLLQDTAEFSGCLFGTAYICTSQYYCLVTIFYHFIVFLVSLWNFNHHQKIYEPTLFYRFSINMARYAILYT